ncbi:MAG: SixA phosphatase family protein [Burkholderiaceae bacterium]
MDLILWRHAEAETGEPDVGRRLTSKGEKQARRVAEWLHSRLPDSAKVYTSPAKRAQQTTNALSQVAHRRFKTLDVLGSSASADEVLAAIGWRGGKGTLVVVGHQPMLGRIASRVMTGRELDWAIKKGGLIWISQRDALDGSEPALRAAIGPDLA